MEAERAQYEMLTAPEPVMEPLVGLVFTMTGSGWLRHVTEDGGTLRLQLAHPEDLGRHFERVA